MRGRRIGAAMVAALALPLLVLGLLDPLEGGPALLGALAMLVVARALSGVPVPRLLWIALVAAVALGGLLLAFVTLVRAAGEPDGSMSRPLGAGVVAGLWVYRAAVLVVIAAGVRYLVLLVRAERPGPGVPRSSSGPAPSVE